MDTNTDMDWKGKELLIRSFLSLDNTEEVKLFLADMMTRKEIEEFSNRLRAAEMLLDEESYVKIAGKTGLSSATIARVGKWVKGGEGGFRLVLKKIQNTDRKTQIRIF